MSTKKLLKLMIPFVLAMVMLAMLLTGCGSDSENKLITIEDPVEEAVYYIQDSKLNQYYQDHTTKEQAVNEFTDSITALRTYLDGESFVDTGYYMGVNYDIDLLDEQNNTAGNFQLRVDAYLYTYPYEDEDGNPIYKYYENGKYYDENNPEGTRTLVNALEIHNEAIKKSDISIEWYNGATNEVMIGLYFDGINSNSDDPGNILYVDIQGARRSFPEFGDTVLYQQMIRLLVHLSVEGLLSALGLQSDAGTSTINEYMIALVGENYKRTVNDDIVSLLFYAITLDVIKDQATNLLVKLFGTFEDKWDPLTYKYLGFRFSSVANATVQTILADMQSDISPDKEGVNNVLTNAMFHLTGVVRDRANAPYHYTCDVSFDYGWVYPDKPLGAVNKDWYKLFDYGNYEFKGKLYVPSWDAQYDALIRTDMNPDDNTINNVFIEFRDIANGELAIGVYYKNERSYLDITGLQYMYGWIDLEYLGFPQVYDEHLDLAYVLRRFQILIGNVIVSIVDGILDPATSDKKNKALEYIMDKTSMTEKIEFSTADEAAERERLLNSQAVSEIREAMKDQYDDNYIREYIEEYIYNAILLKKQESLFSANTETLLVDIELIKQMLEETGAGTFTTRQLINVVDSVLPYTLDQLAIMLGIPSAELMVEKTYFTFTLDVDTNLMTMIMYTNLGIEPGEPSNMMWKLELTPTHFGEAVPIADVNFDRFKPLQQIYTYSGTLKGDFVFSSQETVDLSKLLSATIGESSGLNTPYQLPNNTGLTFTLVYDQFVTDNYVNDDGETVEVGDPSGVWKRQGRSAFDLELKTKKSKEDNNGQVIIRLCSDDVSFNNDMYKQLNDPDPVKRSEAEHAMGYIWVSIECVYKYGQQAIPKVKIREDVFMASMSAYMNGQDKIEDDVSSFADNDFNLSLTSIISALCKDAYVVPEPEQMEITSSNDTLQSLFRVKGLIGNIKVDAGFTYRVKGLLSIKKSYYMYQVGAFKDIVGLNPYTTALHDTLNTHFYQDYRDEYEPLDYDFYVYPEDVLLDDGTMIEEGTIMVFELGARKTLTRQPIRDKLAASSFYNNEPDENLDITEVYFALGDLEEIVTHDVLQNKYYYTTYYNKRIELDDQLYVKQDADNNIYIAWQGLRDIVFYEEGDTYYYFDLQMAMAYEENDEENDHHIGDYIYIYKSEYRRLLFEYDPDSVEVTASCKTQYAPRTNGSFMGETRRYFLRLTSIIPAELGALHSVHYDNATKWPPQFYCEEDEMNVVEIYDDDGKLVDMYYDPIALFVMEPAEPLITSYAFNVCTDPNRTTDYLTWTPENETPHARTKWELSEFATFTCHFIIDWSQVTLKGYFVVTEVIVGEGMMGETIFPCRIIVTNREVDTVEYASLFDKDNYRFNPVDAKVTAPGDAVPEKTYYVNDGDGYVLTTDSVFREGVDYYVMEYYEANVPVVDSISIDPYEYLLAKYKYLSDTNNFSPSGYSSKELYQEAYDQAEERFIISYFEELFEKYPFNISFAWEVSELYRAEVEMDYIAQKYSNVSMDSSGSTVIDKYQWLFDAYLYGNNIEKLIKPAGGTVYIHTRFRGQLIAIRLDVGVRNFSYVKFNVYNNDGVLVREDAFSPEDFDDIQGKYSANYYDQSSYYLVTDPIFVFTDENGKEVEHSFDMTYVKGLNENGTYQTDLYRLRWDYELITNVGTDGSYFMEYLYSPLYASDSETETVSPITSMYVYYSDDMASIDVSVKGGGTRKLYSKNETTGYAYILATSLYSGTKMEPLITFDGEKISYDSLTQAMKETEVRVYNEDRREEDDGYLYVNKGGYAYKRISYEYTTEEAPVLVLTYGLLPMGSANYSLAITSLSVSYSDSGSGVALSDEQRAKRVTVDGVLKSLYADTDRNGYAEKLTPIAYDDIYFDPVLTNKGELVPYKSLSVEQKAQKVRTDSGELKLLYRDIDGHAEIRRETQYKPIYNEYTVFSFKQYSLFTSSFVNYADLTEEQLAEDLYTERGGYAEKKIPIYNDTIVGSVEFLSSSGERVLYSDLSDEMKGRTVTRYNNQEEPYEVALYSEDTDGYALVLAIGETEPFKTSSGEAIYYDRLPGDLKNKTVTYYDTENEPIEVNLYSKDANGYARVLKIDRYSDNYETLVDYTLERVDGYDDTVLLYNEFTKESLFRLYNGKVQIRRADVYLPATDENYCLVVSTKVIQDGRPTYVKYALTGFSNKTELNRKVLVSGEKEEQSYWVSQGADAAIRLGCWYSDNQWEDFVVDGKTFTSLNDISEAMRNTQVYVRKNDYNVDLFRVGKDYYLESWEAYAGTVSDAMKEQKVTVLVEVSPTASYDFILNDTRYRLDELYLYGEDGDGNAQIRVKQNVVEIRKIRTVGTEKVEIVLSGNPVTYSSLTAKELRSRHFDESTLHYAVLRVGGLYKDEWEIFTIGGTAFENTNSFTSAFSGLQATLRPEGMEGELYKSNPQGYVLVRDRSQEKKYLNENLWVEYGIGRAALFVTDVQGNLSVRSNKKESVNRPFYAYYAQFDGEKEKMVYVGSGYRYEYEPVKDEFNNFLSYNSYVRGDMKNEYITNQSGEKFYTYVPFSEIEVIADGTGSVYYANEDYNPADVSVGDDVRVFKRVDISLDSKSNNETAVATINFYSMLRLYSRIDGEVVPISVVTGQIIENDVPGAATGTEYPSITAKIIVECLKKDPLVLTTSVTDELLVDQSSGEGSGNKVKFNPSDVKVGNDPICSGTNGYYKIDPLRPETATLPNTISVRFEGDVEYSFSNLDWFAYYDESTGEGKTTNGVTHEDDFCVYNENGVYKVRIDINQEITTKIMTRIGNEISGYKYITVALVVLSKNPNNIDFYKDQLAADSRNAYPIEQHEVKTMMGNKTASTELYYSYYANTFEDITLPGIAIVHFSDGHDDTYELNWISTERDDQGGRKDYVFEPNTTVHLESDIREWKTVKFSTLEKMNKTAILSEYDGWIVDTVYKGIFYSESFRGRSFLNDALVFDEDGTQNYGNLSSYSNFDSILLYRKINLTIYLDVVVDNYSLQKFEIPSVNDKEDEFFKNYYVRVKEEGFDGNRQIVDEVEYVKISDLVQWTGSMETGLYYKTTKQIVINNVETRIDVTGYVIVSTGLESDAGVEPGKIGLFTKAQNDSYRLDKENNLSPAEFISKVFNHVDITLRQREFDYSLKYELVEGYQYKSNNPSDKSSLRDIAIRDIIVTLDTEYSSNTSKSYFVLNRMVGNDCINVENGLVKVWEDSNKTKEAYISFSDLISMVIANNLKTDFRSRKVVAVDGMELPEDVLDLDEEGEGVSLNDYIALYGLGFDTITLLNESNKEVVYSAAEISYRKTYLDRHVSITHGEEGSYLVIRNKSIAVNNLDNIININDMIAYEQSSTGNLLPMTIAQFNKNKYLIPLGTGMGAYDISTVIVFRNGFYYADEVKTINIVAYDETGVANYASGYNLGDNVQIKLEGVKEYDGGKYGKTTDKTFTYGGANADKLENWYVVSSNVPGVVKGTIITAIPAESIYRTGSAAMGSIELSTVTKEGFYISRRFTIEFFPDEIDNETTKFEIDSIAGGNSFYFDIEDGVIAINNIYEYNDENGLDSYFASPNHLPMSIVLIQNKDEENERRITINRISWTILEKEWINNQYNVMKQATYKGTNDEPYAFAEAYVLGFRSTALNSMQGQIRLIVKIKITSAEIELLPWEDSEIGLSTDISYNGSRREFVVNVDAYNNVSSSTFTEKGVLTLPTTFKAYTVDGILFTFRNVSYRFNDKSVSKIYYNINGIDVDRMTARGAELSGSGITNIRSINLFAEIGLNQSLYMTFYFYDKEVKTTEAVLTISDEAIRKKIYDLLVDNKSETQSEMLQNINIKRIKTNLEMLMTQAQQLQSEIVMNEKLPSAMSLYSMNSVESIEKALYSSIPTVPEKYYTSEDKYDPSAVSYSKVRPWLQDDYFAYATYFIRQAAVEMASGYAARIYESRNGTNQVTARNNISKLITQYAAAYAASAYDAMIQTYMERELAVLLREKYMATNVDAETLNDSIGYKNAVEGLFDAEQLLNNVIKLRRLTDKDSSLRSLRLYAKQFDLTYSTMYGYFKVGNDLTAEKLYRALIIEQVYRAIFAADEQFGLRVNGRFQRSANVDLIHIRQTVIELLFARMGIDCNYREFTPVVGGYAAGVYYLNSTGIYVQGKSTDDVEYVSMKITTSQNIRVFRKEGNTYVSGYFHLDENGFMIKGKGPDGITYYSMQKLTNGTEETVIGKEGFAVEGGYRDGSYAIPTGITDVTMDGLLTVLSKKAVVGSGEEETLKYVYVSKQVRSAINAVVERWFDFTEGVLLLEDSVENIELNNQRRLNVTALLGMFDELRSSIVRYSFASIGNYSSTILTLRRGLINGVDFTSTLNNLLGKAVENFLNDFFMESKYVTAIRQARRLNMTSEEVYRLPTEENYLSNVTYYDIVRVTAATFDGGKDVYELSSDSYFFRTSDSVYNTQKTYYTFVKRESDMRYIPVTVVTNAINLNELTVLARDTIGDNYYVMENGIPFSATGGNFQQNVQYYYYGDAIKFHLSVEAETVYRAEEDIQFGTNEYYKFVEIKFVDGDVVVSGETLEQNYAQPYTDREYDSAGNKYVYHYTTDTLFGMDEYRDYNGKEQYYRFIADTYSATSGKEYFKKTFDSKTETCSDKHAHDIEGEDPRLSVKYDDCNAFGKDITDENGYPVQNAISELSAHTMTAQLRDAMLTSFDNLSGYFTEFIGQYSFQDGFNYFRTPAENAKYAKYETFWSQMYAIFDGSENTVSKAVGYTAPDGALLGISRDLLITFGADDVSGEYEDLMISLARLFGYGDVEAFKENAINIAETYRSFSSDSNNNHLEKRMKFDGAIFTSNRSFILPFVFKNGDIRVLACVIVDRYGNLYVWIGDTEKIKTVANLGNVLGVEGGEKTLTEVYGRCELFEVVCRFERKTSVEDGDSCYSYTTVYVVDTAENAKAVYGGAITDFGYHLREYDAGSKTYTVSLASVSEYYEMREDGRFYLTQDTVFTQGHKYYAKLLLRKEGESTDYKEGENVSIWQARKNPFIEVTEKPGDWDATYYEYYIKVEGEYIRNQSSEWVSGRKYFIRENYYFEETKQALVYRLVTLYNTDTYYLYNEIPTVYSGRPSAYNVTFDEEYGGATYRYSVAWPKSAISSDIDYRGGDSDLSSALTGDSTGITQYLEQKLVVNGHILGDEDLIVRDALGEKALEVFTIKHNTPYAQLPQITGYDYQVVDSGSNHYAVFRRKEDNRLYRIDFTIYNDTVINLSTMDVYDSEGYLMYRFSNTYTNGKLTKQSLSVYNPFEFALSDLPSIVRVGDESLAIVWNSVSILPTGNLSAESPVIYGNIVGSKGQQISMNLYVAAWNYAGLYQPTEQVTDLQYEVNGKKVYFSYLNPIYCYFSSYFTRSSVDYYLADISIRILTESGKVSTVSLPKLNKKVSEMFVDGNFTISGVDFGTLEFDSARTEFLKKIFYPYIDKVIGGVDYSSRMLQYGAEDSGMQQVLLCRNYLLYWDVNTLNGLMSDSRHIDREGTISLGNERIGFYTLSSLVDPDDKTTPTKARYVFESMNISELQVMSDNICVTVAAGSNGDETITFTMPYYNAYFTLLISDSSATVTCSNGHSASKQVSDIFDGSKYTIKCEDASCSLKEHSLRYAPGSGACVCESTTCDCSVFNDVKNGLIGKSGQIPLIMDIHSTYPETGTIVLKENNVKYDMNELKVRLLWNVQEDQRGFEEVIAELKMFVNEKYPDVDKSAQENYAINLFMSWPNMSSAEKENVIKLAMEYCKEHVARLKNASDSEVRKEAYKLLAVEQKYDFASKTQRLSGGGDAGVMVTVLVVADGNTNVYRQVLSVRVIFSDYTPLGYYATKEAAVPLSGLRTSQTELVIDEKTKSTKMNGNNGTYFVRVEETEKSGNIPQGKYFERVGNEYVLTKDETFKAKEYYTLWTNGLYIQFYGEYWRVDADVPENSKDIYAANNAEKPYDNLEDDMFKLLDFVWRSRKDGTNNAIDFYEDTQNNIFARIRVGDIKWRYNEKTKTLTSESFTIVVDGYTYTIKSSLLAIGLQ